MAKRLAPTTLRRLSTRRIQTAAEGDHADGGNLVLRVRDLVGEVGRLARRCRCWLVGVVDWIEAVCKVARVSCINL